MAIDLVIPTVGESITEVEIGAWLKQPGEAVEQDEAIVEIESDKATVELYAPVSGVLGEILKQTGETAAIGDIVGTMEAGFLDYPRSGRGGMTSHSTARTRH
jgi:2-oxoglutarate dehydrogenase E2 component (dihydrolipoamide succinyltransferase)